MNYFCIFIIKKCKFLEQLNYKSIPENKYILSNLHELRNYIFNFLFSLKTNVRLKYGFNVRLTYFCFIDM